MLNLLLLVAVAATPVAKHKVEVEGATYRVEVKGDAVRVFRKTLQYRPSLETRDRMRVAVTKATGCQITDDFFPFSMSKLFLTLEGRLVCPVKESN